MPVEGGLWRLWLLYGALLGKDSQGRGVGLRGERPWEAASLCPCLGYSQGLVLRLGHLQFAVLELATLAGERAACLVTG